MSDKSKPTTKIPAGFLDPDKIPATQAATESVLIPAATVVLIRETQDKQNVEILMLRRNSKLNFAGGQWVFPGGRIDDHELKDSAIESAAQVAAVRETLEETGLDISDHTLHQFARWTAPEAAKKRFDTFFYVAVIERHHSSDVEIDGGEIHEYRWMTPTAVLTARDEKEIEILPPTYVTLVELSDFSNTSDALNFYKQRPVMEILPKTSFDENKVVMLYPGDIGYEGNDHKLSDGPQHRFIMGPDSWIYTNSI